MRMPSLPRLPRGCAKLSGGRPAVVRRGLALLAAPLVYAVAAAAPLWREPAGTAAAFAAPVVAPVRHPWRATPEVKTPARVPVPAPVRGGSRFLAAASRFSSLAVTAASAAVVAAFAALPRRRSRDGCIRPRFQGLSSGIIAGLPAAFKAFSQSDVAMMLRLSTLNFCKIYMAMLGLRITIMWFPNINPYRQPFYSMIQLTDPYLNLFRGWMPPIFGIDLSVILAFVVIQAVIDTLTVSPF
mmetsp:Transcript_14114/g.40339  ORF Transcript_14114/g.40339 Transcript_14114/m.40339 type:complete len:241 (-) Transcript_14114:84-806(-)